MQAIRLTGGAQEQAVVEKKILEEVSFMAAANPADDSATKF